jgi:hypothetical protein
MIRLRSLAFALASLGLALSTGVHVASFFARVPMRVAWPLHVGVVALAFPLVVTARARRRGPFGPSIRELLASAPPWGERAFQLVFLYCLAQFGLVLLATRALTVDRAVSPRFEGRVVSAFWMAVYLLCALVWWKPKPVARPGGELAPPPYPLASAA